MLCFYGGFCLYDRRQAHLVELLGFAVRTLPSSLVSCLLKQACFTISVRSTLLQSTMMTGPVPLFRVCVCNFVCKLRCCCCCCCIHSILTRSEVKTVFERAIQRQNGWDNTSAAGNAEPGASSLRRTAVVFMDEAGLPEEAKESLKVLHYYLDDPSVAFVAITNRALDAAKMNRYGDAVELGRHMLMYSFDMNIGMTAALLSCSGPLLTLLSCACSWRARLARVKSSRVTQWCKPSPMRITH